MAFIPQWLSLSLTVEWLMPSEKCRFWAARRRKIVPRILVFQGDALQSDFDMEQNDLKTFGITILVELQVLPLSSSSIPEISLERNMPIAAENPKEKKKKKNGPLNIHYTALGFCFSSCWPGLPSAVFCSPAFCFSAGGCLLNRPLTAPPTFFIPPLDPLLLRTRKK